MNKSIVPNGMHVIGHTVRSHFVNGIDDKAGVYETGTFAYPVNHPRAQRKIAKALRKSLGLGKKVSLHAIVATAQIAKRKACVGF